MTAGVKNVIIFQQKKIVITPIHIKLGLMKQFVKALGKEGTCFQFLSESYLSLKENVRNFEKLQQKYLRKIYIIQKSFGLKILFLCF